MRVEIAGHVAGDLGVLLQPPHRVLVPLPSVGDVDPDAVTVEPGPDAQEPLGELQLRLFEAEDQRTGVRRAREPFGETMPGSSDCGLL